MVQVQTLTAYTRITHNDVVTESLGAECLGEGGTNSPQDCYIRALTVDEGIRKADSTSMLNSELSSGEPPSS